MSLLPSQRIKVINGFLSVDVVGDENIPENERTICQVNLNEAQSRIFNALDAVDPTISTTDFVIYFKTDLKFWLNSADEDGYGKVELQSTASGEPFRTLRFTNTNAVNYLRSILT